MKRIFVTATFLMIAMVATAQKREIRKAGNAIEDKNFAEAKNYLKEAEAELSDANDNVKADFYYNKAMAYLGAENQTVSLADMRTAAAAMQKAVELEHDDAAHGLRFLENRIVTSAIKDQQNQKFNDAAEKLLITYKMDEKDTVYMYYAASNFASAKDYDNALKYYEKLNDLGFTGIETQYVATNKATGEVESFPKKQRDLLVSKGAYSNPEDRKTESKAGEIIKNIALIHIQNEDVEKARKAIEQAKAANPNDTDLLLVEADMYNRIGDMKNYKRVMSEVVQMDPNNPTLFYNLGVSSAQLGEKEDAIKYYKRALELNPDMVNAQVNLASVILEGEKAIVEEMNSLGTSAADNKKYNQLSKKRNDLFMEALPYLESAYKSDPNSIEVIRTLMNIYYQTNQLEKAKEIKAKLAELQG